MKLTPLRQTPEPALYLTITDAPVSVAAAEKRPAVTTKILLKEITGDDLLLIVHAAKGRLERPHGDD